MTVLNIKAQPENTIVYFDQMEWNFGVIKEEDGKVSHSFHYSNGGKSPLMFYSVNTSCGCTTPTYRKEPLLPGNSDDFIVTYDPTGRPGRFEKYIIIQGNMEGNNITLKIKGVVEAKPRGIEDDYPILLSKGIRLSDSQIDFGAIPNTRESSGNVKFYNNSDNRIKVGIDTNKIPEWMKVDVPEQVIEPHTSCIENIVISPEKDMWGRRSIMLPIIVDNIVQPIELFVHGDLTEDFALISAEERNNAPYCILSSYFYSFSDSRMGEELKREFTITNKGKSPLKIRYVDYNKNKINVSIHESEIAVGQSTKITIMVNSDTAEDIAEIIRIISNDPIYPVREIRVIAKIN